MDTRYRLIDNVIAEPADALNPARASRFAVGRHRRGVSDPLRWVKHMKKLLLLPALTALFAATSAPAQTNEILGVPEDELTVIVNAEDLAGLRRKEGLLEQHKMYWEMRPKGAGIGALIAKGKDGQPVIVKSLPDSPCAKAGLIKGDVIVAVGREPTKGLEITSVISLLRGYAGSIVTVTISRPGLADPFEAALRREQIKYTPNFSRATGRVQRTLIIRNGEQIP